MSAIGAGFGNDTAIGKSPDADGDGAPDWWENTVFGVGGISVDCAKDADGDGMTAADEYLSGTNPSDPFSVLAVEAVMPDRSSGANITIRWNSVEGKTYSIERSANLLEGFEPVATGLKATPPVNEYQDTVNGRQYFYRIKAR